VYVAGHDGVLLIGRSDTWHVVDQIATRDIIWDTDWFKDHLYVSTMSNLYRLAGTDLEPVDFGEDRPRSCYQLSSVDAELWSNGEFDLMSFDGIKWTRIV
jgi:hypothetical protein